MVQFTHGDYSVDKPLRSELDLHRYQLDGVDFTTLTDLQRVALFALMGAGKTAVTLTAITKLVNEFMVHKTLVIAPLRVAQTVWPKEPKLWSHLNHLRVSPIVGDEAARRAAVEKDADIYVINFENLAWFVETYCGIAVRSPAKPRAPKQRKGEDDSSFAERLEGHAKNMLAWEYLFSRDNPKRWKRGKKIGHDLRFWDLLVVDESRKLHDHQSEIFYCAKKLAPPGVRVIELTGKPRPQGLEDLWGQIYLLDHGARLGHTVTAFRQRWFTYNEYTRKYTPKKHAEAEIAQLISDIVMVIETYDGLPEGKRNSILLELPAAAKAAYDDFELERIMELPEGELTPANAAVLTNKLLQFASGFVYDDKRAAHYMHSAKLDALAELVDTLNGDPLLVAYWYEEDKRAILERLPKAQVLDKAASQVDAWNRGEIPVLLIHPQGGAHGLNMQENSANLCWYSLTWSLDLYDQLNARLLRQGQKRLVLLHHLIAVGTLDEIVMAVLDSNGEAQDRFLTAVKHLVHERRAAARLRSGR